MSWTSFGRTSPERPWMTTSARAVERRRLGVDDDQAGAGADRRQRDVRGGIDHERRADHEHHVRGTGQLVSLFDRGGGIGWPKNTTVGLSMRRRKSDTEAASPVEARLDLGARLPRAAGQAFDSAAGAVQLDHAAAARGLVEAVGVLGDDRDQVALRLEPASASWPGLGLAASATLPRSRATASTGGVGEERVDRGDLHRVVLGPQTAFAAEGRDAALCRDSRPVRATAERAAPRRAAALSRAGGAHAKTDCVW
jgi:hypothetical protein